MNARLAACVSMLALFVSIPDAGAAVLDFRETGAASNTVFAVSALALSNAELTTDGPTFFVGFGYGENENGIACGGNENGNCLADWVIQFGQDVQNLTLASFGAELGDKVEVSAFLNGVFKGVALVTDNTTLDFSSLGLINRLVFDDGSSFETNGIGFGNFEFSPIPIPAALPMFAAGVAAVACAGRRRKAKATA